MACSLVGLCGLPGSGKNEAANALTARGWKQLAFADAIREAALALDPLVEMPTGGAVRLSDAVMYDGWDYVKRNYPEARRLLQRLGTEVARKLWSENFWNDITFGKLDAMPGEKVVITDVRFRNEANGILERGGMLVKISRPGLQPSRHVSDDLSVLNDLLDGTIENDGTVDDLHADLLGIVGCESLSS